MPILLIVAAVGLFAVYTNPTYQKIKELQVQSAQYDKALTQSTQLRQLRDQLLQKRNVIATNDLQSIDRMLPENVDNIRLIIDINDIAARDGLQASNISVGAPGQDSAASVGASTGPIGSVDLSFSVNATYSQFLQFLNDMEHSLRIIDIEGITFSAGAKDTTTYTFQVRTYWLR